MVSGVHLLLAAAACAWPHPAAAQTSPPEDASAADGDQSTSATPATGDLVVTAQRRVQSLEDVPVSATVFTSEDVDRNRIEGLDDYFDRTPNVGFQNSGNPRTYQISIRGVSNLGDITDIGATNSLGIYVDEFNVTPTNSSGTYEQNLVDVERIEVLRGPQGVFFGRNVIGGAINITTKKPGNELEANLVADYGNFSTGLIRGAVNLPLLQDRLAVRASAFYSESDGFLRDIGPAGNTNDFRNVGGRVAVRWTPTDRLTFDVTASRTEYDQGFENGVPTGVLIPVLQQVGLSPIIQGQGVYPENRRRIATNTPFSITNDTTLLTGQAQYEFDGGAVVWTSGLIRNRGTQAGDSDLTAFDFYDDDNRERLRSWSTELRVQSDGAGPWNYTVGAIYADDRRVFSQIRNFRAPFISLFFRVPPAVAEAIAPVRIVDIAAERDSRSVGVFADLSWKGVGDRLTLSAGARYSNDRISTSLLDNGITSALVPQGDFSSGKATFDDVSPRFTATYEIEPRLTVYGVVSKGYKPGGFNLGANDGPNLPETFAPEKAWNFEAGVKGSTDDGRLRGSIAAFYLSWRDIQQQSRFTNPQTLETINFTDNAARATSKGVELELTAQPVPALQLGFAAGYNDARFDRYDNALDQFQRPIDASGNRLPLTSRWTLSGFADLRFDVASGTRGFARGEVNHRGEFFRFVENSDAVGDRVPAYQVVNVRAGLEWDRLTLSAYVENLLDDNYVVGWRADNSLSGLYAVIQPRRYGIRAIASF